MLSRYFKEILNQYGDEKSKDYKSSRFAHKFREELPKKIFSLINNDEFNVKASCGFINWAKYPWVSIKHNSFDLLNQSLLIFYKFNTENSTISISLVPKLEEYEDYSEVKKVLSKTLLNFDIKEFELSDDSFVLLSKTYNYGDLTDSTLINDLNLLINIYNNIQSIFKKLIKEYYDNSSEIYENRSIFDESLFSQENLIIEDNVLFRRKRILFSDISNKIQVKNIKTSPIIKNKYNCNMNNIDEFFTDEIIDKIIEGKISIKDYNDILEDIKLNNLESLVNIRSIYSLNINELSIKDKILLYSKSFTNTEYKSIGKLLGSYSFNTIKIDDRLPTPLIITSMIHELSHFLLEKILKEVLMKILDSNDTPLISSYVKILLEDNDLNYLFDEFCAHTVEGRFALYGYQDYSSFKYKLNEISDLYSNEDIDYALLIANTFAYDIKDIIEEFIDDDLREDIKDEFLKLPDKPNYEPLDLEIDSKLENDYFIEALALVLTSGVGEVLNNPQKLDRYIDKYEEIFKNYS